MNKTILIVDLETDSVDPEQANPIQIGAIAIDPLRLQVIPDSEFYSWCQPEMLEHPNYYKDHKNTIDFHLRNYGMNLDQFVAKLKTMPSEKQVFENFVEYTKKYHTKATSQNIFTAPKFAGYNAAGFDFPIISRLCKKYGNVDKNGKQNLWFDRDSIDIMKMVIWWLEPLNEIKSYSMDTLREYFGMDVGQAHDAMFDVKQEAQLLIKFLKLYKTLAPQINFRKAFEKGSNNG